MCPISETNAEWHAETIKSCGWPAAGSPLLNPPHPFFRLSFLLAFFLWFFHCIPHFQALPGRMDWQRDDEGQRRETEQGKTECVSKTHLVGITTCPGARRTDPMLESHHSPSHGVQVSHSCSGAQRRWHTNGWSSLARRKSSMHSVSSKGHETVNQRTRDGNATKPLVWGNSQMSRKDVIRSLRNPTRSKSFPISSQTFVFLISFVETSVEQRCFTLLDTAFSRITLDKVTMFITCKMCYFHFPMTTAICWSESNTSGTNREHNSSASLSNLWTCCQCLKWYLKGPLFPLYPQTNRSYHSNFQCLEGIDGNY